MKPTNSLSKTIDEIMPAATRVRKADIDIDKHLDELFLEKPELPAFDIEQAKRHIDALMAVADNIALEIRCIKNGVKGCYKVTEQFNEYELAQILEAHHGKEQVYITCNPFPASIDPPIKDKFIEKRYWLPFDFDPIREKGTPATADEQQKAEQAANWFIQKLGISNSNYFRTMSGNGVFLLVRIEPLSCSPETDKKIRNLYSYWKGELSKVHPAVEFDTTVINPSRIMKLAGTLSVKGDHSTERPWRLCEITHEPKPIKAIDAETLFAAVPEVQKVEIRERPSEPIQPREIKPNEEIDLSKFKGMELIGDFYRDEPKINGEWAQYRIGKGGPCACCGNAHSLDCEGITNRGYAWGICWRTESWGKLGTEGKDWKLYDTLGENGAAFFWKDGYSVNPDKQMEKKFLKIVNQENSESISKWIKESKADKSLIDEIAGETKVMEIESEPEDKTEEKEPVFYADNLRDGFLKTATKFFTQRMKLKKSDAVAYQAALALNSLLYHNKVTFKGFDGTERRLNPWFLLVAPSGTGKSTLYNGVERIFNEIAENQLVSVSQLSESSFINACSLHPDRMFLFRADEFAIFDKVKTVANLKQSMMSWKAGESASNVFMNNTDKKKGRTLEDLQKTVSDFQFQIFAQTTPAWLFEHTSTTDITGGFLGRFLVVYDDDIRAERGLELNSETAYLEACERTGGRISKETIIEMGKAVFERCNNGRTLNLSSAANETLNKMVLVELNKINAFDAETFCALSTRLVSIITEVAALIEISHFREKGDWELETSISVESVKEAVDFVIPEFVKWYAAINSNLGVSKTGELRNKAEKWINDNWSKRAEWKDKSDGERVKGITLSDFRRSIRGIDTMDFAKKLINDISDDGKFRLITVELGERKKKTLLIVKA